MGNYKVFELINMKTQHTKICGMELKQNRGKFIAMTLDSTLQNQKKWDK